MSLRIFLLPGIVALTVFGCSSPTIQEKEQIQSLPMEAVSLDKLDAFGPPKGSWQLAANVYANPDQPYSMELTKGTGILAGVIPPNATDSAEIHTKWDHRDIDLELDFMLSAGAAGAIVFQDHYPLLLKDSWLKDSAVADLCGGVRGQAPLLNACKAPGLWQHLEVRYRAAPVGQQYEGHFDMVKLNGSIIHDTTLRSMIPGKGRLGFRVNKGSIAFRNIRYKTYHDEHIKLADVQYHVYKGVFKNHDTLKQLTPVRSGRTDSLTYRVGDKRGHLLLEGKLIVPVAGHYVFRVQAGGPVRLKIDTVEIANNGGTRDFQRPFYGDTTLQQGEHTFQLSYANYDESMVLMYEGPHIPFTALTTAASERKVEADPLMEYPVQNEAVIQRGFMRHHGKVDPYSMAIGIPGGLNYAYDMVNYSPLMAWHGRFIDVAEMWHERGEKQLAKPMGAILELAGVPCIAALSSPDAPWPDTIREDSSSYTNRGYRLLPNGLPVFFYTLHQWQVEDYLSPGKDGKGLNRDVTITTQQAAKGNAYWLMASGGLIEKLPDGSYAVDDKSYYITTDGAPQIQQNNDQYRLLLPLQSGAGKVKIHYSIIW